MSSLNRVVCCTAAPLLASAWIIACSHEKQPETGGYQQGQVQYGQQTAGQGGQAVGGQATVPPPGYGPVTPAAGGAAAGGVGGAPTVPATAAGAAAGGARAGAATVVDAATATVLQPVLNQLAKSFTVAGAKPVGTLLVANFQAGQYLEGQIQLQPQKCYTIVATGLPPITELNLQLVATTVLPNVTPVLATDSESGPTAVIGKKPNCYRWAFPLPAPAKLILQVAAGTGLAAVQVYEK